MFRSFVFKFVLSLMLLGAWESVCSVPGAWAEDLPDAIVQLPENTHGLVVEKKSQTLMVFGNDSESQSLALRFKAPCSTGEIAGPKEKSGDKKTPEGIYFLIDEYEDKYLSPIYGSKAFPTDYPNFLDQRAGKNGSAIWIHGTDKLLKPMESNGCVAMNNTDILELAKLIDLHQTPIVIVESTDSMDVGARNAVAGELNQALEGWATALAQGTYHDYLAAYSSTFLPEMDFWESWQENRDRLSQDKRVPAMRLDKVGLYHQDAVYVALFDLHLTAGGQSAYLGKRQLFLKKEAAGFKIIGDVYHTRAKEYAEAKVSPLVAASRVIWPAQANADEILIVAKAWLKAWADKDMEAYAGYYASDFVSDGLRKKAWVRRKTQLSKKYDYIHVSGREFKVIKRKYGYEVRFFQEYASSGFSTDGTKQLKLKMEGGEWKIFQENWKEK